MANKELSVDMHVQGTVLSIPADLHMGIQNSHFLIQGDMHTSNTKLENIVRMIDKDVADNCCSYLKKLDNLIPEDIAFRYSQKQCMIWFASNNCQFGVTWDTTGTAIIVTASRDDNAPTGSLDYYLSLAAKELGIKQVFLYVNKGSGNALPLLTHAVLGKEKKMKVPSKLSANNILFCGSFCFDKTSLVGEAMKTLFGIDNVELNMFFAMNQREFMGYVMLPIFESDILKAQELYFGIGVKDKGIQMVLSGSFYFSFLKGILFRAECGLSNQGFMIEAFAHMEAPIQLFGNFKIGDTCLAIGYNRGFVFQLFSNLYLGQIKMFGAVGVSVGAIGTKVDLMSVAVTDITLSTFVNSLLKNPVNGVEQFDFIKLLGFPIAQSSNISINKQTSKQDAVRIFNDKMSDDQFKLNVEQTQIESFNDGVILTDKKRMRHYYVNGGGKLQLQAQFYYAIKDMTLGAYTITSGIFMCCSIELFGKISIRVLFSISEADGVTAYANISELNLGIIKLSSSGMNSATDTPLAKLSEKSLMRQFVNTDDKGAVFYLRAGKNEVSFYIDAKLELLGVFQFVARILYAGKNILLDARLSIGAGIDAVLHIGASYSDFSNANFSFGLMIDCTGLEKKLKSVNEKIEMAVKKLREKMDSAKNQITQAQRHVDELYGQINGLDNRIGDCCYAISHAKWYKKVFVAIAKGIEIAAYEVAKIALYAAIGVAKAALEVAKQIVNIAGIVGEGVLKAVQGVITAALNLFFVRYINMQSKASMQEQYFSAEIEFVALGKTYHYSTTIGQKAIADNPTATLGDNIGNRVDSDLQNIDKGTFRSNRRRYAREEYTIEQHAERLRAGMEQINSGTRLLCGMQDIYMENCGESMPEFEEMNVSYNQAMNDISSMLDVANLATDTKKMNEVVESVEEKLAGQEENTRDIKIINAKKTIEDYKKSTLLLDRIQRSITNVELQRNTLKEHVKSIREQETGYQNDYVRKGELPSSDMEQVFNKTEEMMYEEFPVSRNRASLINLSRESKIRTYMDEAREEFGCKESQKIEKMRTRTAVNKYEERL